MADPDRCCELQETYEKCQPKFNTVYKFFNTVYSFIVLYLHMFLL